MRMAPADVLQGMFITPSTADDTPTAHETATAQFGFLPNWAVALGGRPAVLTAWNQLNGEIRRGMDRRRYELATIAAARELRSTYCAVAHSWLLTRKLGLVDPDDLAAILGDGADPIDPVDPVDRAVMAFAAKVARDAAAVTAADVQELRDAGLSDDDVLDVALAVAARCFFATALDAVGAQADRELADALGPPLAAALTVGRPVASS
jgi:uncharacterized peroxidase-related enzyme